MTTASYFLGLDLGQAQDFTALAVLEATPGVDAAGRFQRSYACRWLQRWPLGTKYPAIIRDLADLLTKPPLDQRPPLAADQTGVGRAVVDMLTEANLPADLTPILITAGHAETRTDGAYHVPKKELVSTLQVLLQSGWLRIARELEHAATLQRELTTFKVKVTTAGNETFEAWRERDHDDLVLAVALAAWTAEREPDYAAAWEGVVIGRGRAESGGLYQPR